MADDNSILVVHPCPKCGTAERYTDGRCKACARARCIGYYGENKEKMNANSVRWHANNREQATINSAAWAAANREKSRAIKQKWAKANPEKIKAKAAAYYQKNSEKLIAAGKAWDKNNRDKANAADAAWRKNNPERYKAAYTAQRKNNPELYKAIAAAYRKRNPETVRIRDHARRAIGKQSSSQAKGLIDRLIKLQRGLCPCCKQPLGEDFHMNHVIPLARGGSIDGSNIQLMRAICNMQKSAKDPIDYMQSKGFLI